MCVHSGYRLENTRECQGSYTKNTCFKIFWTIIGYYFQKHLKLIVYTFFSIKIVTFRMY